MLNENAGAQVRPPAVAGRFYPVNPLELSRDVRRNLDKTEDLKLPSVIGLLVPHAGYMYSGATAAAGYKQAAGQRVDLAVVISPTHSDNFQGATIYPGEAYETPLGRMQIDKKTAEKLVSSNTNVHFSERGHRAEHALEVQLPFLQTLFPQALLLPLVTGPAYSWNWEMCESVGRSLAEAVRGKNVLIIASSDLYHGDSYSDCVRISKETLDAVTRLQPQALFQGLKRDTFQACGGVPAVIMEVAAMGLGADETKLIAQTNSNDVTGTRGGYVVGYGAVALYKKAQQSRESDKKEFRPLPLTEQKYLLRSARHAIAERLKIKTVEPPAKIDNPLLKEKRGVFVTLTQKKQLRGCIGRHEADVPLEELVRQMACAAAFEDPRFPPLQPEEFDHTDIKISVYLTNVYRIYDLSEFKMGEHGIILKKGFHAATYLPEVPLEAGWKTVDEEMASLCRKAGLPPDAWKSGAEFWVYKTQVFDESILKK